MKLVGGEEGYVNKDEENSGLARFTVFCFVQTPLIYDFVTGKGAALIARKCIHIFLFPLY